MIEDLINGHNEEVTHKLQFVQKNKLKGEFS